MMNNRIGKISCENNKPKHFWHTVLFVWVYFATFLIFHAIPIVYDDLFRIYFSFVQIFGLAILAMRVKLIPLTRLNRPGLFLASLLFGKTVISLAEGFQHYYDYLLPVFGFVGYVYSLTIRLEWRVFIGFYFLQVVYFLVEYYSKLPHLFFRPGFDEDAVIFDRASSNCVSICLNFTIISILHYDYYSAWGIKRFALILSLLNLVLVFIQQSRVGIIVAWLMVVLAAIRAGIAFRRVIFSNIFILCIIFAFRGIDYVQILGESIGDISAAAYFDDIRSEAVKNFFVRINNFSQFLLGPGMSEVEISESEYIGYSYNSFIDVWSRYTFIGFSLLLINFSLTTLKGIWCRENYRFFLLTPILFYSLFESLYFPNFWDAIIFSIIFISDLSVNNIQGKAPRQQIVLLDNGEV